MTINDTVNLSVTDEWRE